MNPTQPSIPVKAQTKHIVLFVVACIFLVGALASLSFPAILMPPVELPSDSSEPVDEPLPGAIIIGVMVMGMAYAFVGFVAMVIFFICWGGGQVISALLAMDRQNTPKWLWVASLVLALVYLAIMLVMLGLQFLT